MLSIFYCILLNVLQIERSLFKIAAHQSAQEDC